MTTRQVYWEDTYLFTYGAEVVELGTSDQNGLDFVVLNATIFYPQGGGQPCDQGEIKCGDNTFIVEDVRMTNGRVIHYGKWAEQTKFSEGDQVQLNIDQERRLLNARSHSAGHLLDNVVQDLGLAWVPGKGYHFPTGAYVEYAGNAPAEKRAEILSKIQEGISQGIAKDYSVNVEIVDYDKVAEKCGGVCPDYLPVGKEARIVSINGLGCPCAGTHVKNVSEIGSVKITKITYKKGVVRVSYAISQ